MFERYTEKARRVIFFARYEASQFGASQIEAEHILLGLMREDKNLTSRYVRSPASLMANITARTNGAREQVVTVTGGPGHPAGSRPSIEACEGRSPHGFIDQEAAVAAGIARFIREGTY